MTNSGLRWKAPPAAVADDEDSSAASSISDVFVDVRTHFSPCFIMSVSAHISLYTQMLNVNEDMIVAAAECQAEGDVEGLVA